jgi:hypothetical protein
MSHPKKRRLLLLLSVKLATDARHGYDYQQQSMQLVYKMQGVICFRK